MEQEREEQPVCQLCGREVSLVSKHHLLPKQKGGKHTQTVDLCQPCHRTIHLHQPALHFRTIAGLQQAGLLQKFLTWIRDKNIDKISNRRGGNDE